MNKMKKVAATIMALIMLIICLPSTIIAAENNISPDTLIGIWERYGDLAEGTQIKVVNENGVCKATVVKVTGTLIDLGFVVGDLKWKEIRPFTQSTYRGYDLYRYTTGEKTYVNIEITVIDSQKIAISMLDKMSNVIIGQAQTWRKIASLPPVAVNPKLVVMKLGSVDITIGVIKKKLASKVQLINNVIYAPMSDIFKSTGVKVINEVKTKKKITFIKGTKKVVFTLGSKVALVNGKTVKLSSILKASGSDILVPVKLTVEALGFKYSYNSATKTTTLDLK